MCGIAAILSPDKSDHALIEAMTDTMSYRGPDNRGFFHDGMVSLGHRRLSIIDLSADANQPMSNEDGTVFLVCNGEIYNYKEKTDELKARGHIFKSKSDCETLIHLYEDHGEDFLHSVNGMYALVIWDARKKRVLAAVDRFGKKPLYYVFSAGRLLLASEMKSLLIFSWVSRDIDPQAVDRYLSLRYVPAPLSIIKSARKLEPSTLMLYEGGKITTKRYWNLRPQNIIPYNKAAVDAFQALFYDAVRLRLQSDVPLGVYLSGGVDSSAVAGVMKELSKGIRQSFTLSVDYKYDERARAERIAQYLDYEFNPVTIKQDDFNLLPTVVYHLDEPFGDLLCIPAYLLACAAKQKLTVVLTGDGADEIFTGYFHQKIMNIWRKWNFLFATPGINEILSRCTKAIPASILNVFFDYPDQLKVREKLKLSQALKDCAAFGTFYDGITSCFTQEDKYKLYATSFVSGLPAISMSEEYTRDMRASEGIPFYSRLSVLDLKYWLPFSLIYRLDKLNMAKAVETRSPFLDYRVVEMVLSLSDKGKLNRRRNKEILRGLIERLYPPHLREKGKQAFYMPVTSQYRQKFFEWVSDLLTERTIEQRGLFQWPYIKQLLGQFNTQSMLINRQLISLAMLELWFRTFYDSKNLPEKGLVYD